MSDYSKSKPKELEPWLMVVGRLHNGFCIRRLTWPPGDYAFMVTSANYTAKDYVTGFVEDFLVRRVGFKDVIWVPDTADREADDWQVYTRQETHSFPRHAERSTQSLQLEEHVTQGE
jgi:hypothetical protein